MKELGLVAWILDVFDAVAAFHGSLGLVDYETHVVGLEFEARQRGEMPASACSGW